MLKNRTLKNTGKVLNFVCPDKWESECFTLVLYSRLNNVFIIGKGTKAWVSLPRGNGVKLSIAEERDKRLASK